MIFYAIIQARMGSSRLPGKTLLLLNDKCVLQHIVDRVKLSKYIKDNIVVATGINTLDDPIENYCIQENIEYYRGDDNDVLTRYASIIPSDAKGIIRITADCPFIDPSVIDQVIDKYIQTGADYCSNIHPPTFPDGMDVEVFSVNTLYHAHQHSFLESEREHVTPFIWKNCGIFLCENLESDINYSDYRVTLDDNRDLEIMSKIAAKIKTTNFQEIVDLIDSDPTLKLISNRNASYNKDVEKENRFSSNFDHYLLFKSLSPGASQTYSKSWRMHPPGISPNFISRAYDCFLIDVDGNVFIDYSCALGAVTIGYRIENIDEAVINQISNSGVSFTLPHESEITLADKLIRLIPCAKMVKFLKNGSDATTAAVRLARAYTKKDVIATCGYHGFHDWYIGSTINNLGVPESVQELTKTFVYNDPESLEKVLKNGDVAGVILEPCQSNGPKNDFLKKVRQLCNFYGAVLIFDEVVSGFRIDIAGAQSLYNVMPDLAAFGKGMGNGYAISCLVGSKEIMELIDSQNVFISTTFGGDCVGIAAANATIDFMINNNTVEYCKDLGALWLYEVQKLIESKNLSHIVEIYGITPHCGVIFKKFENMKALDFQLIYQKCLYDCGIISLGINNFCYSHSRNNIRSFIKCVDKALDLVKLASENGVNLKESLNPIFNRNN